MDVERWPNLFSISKGSMVYTSHARQSTLARLCIVFTYIHWNLLIAAARQSVELFRIFPKVPPALHPSQYVCVRCRSRWHAVYTTTGEHSSIAHVIIHKHLSRRIIHVFILTKHLHMTVPVNDRCDISLPLSYTLWVRSVSLACCIAAATIWTDWGFASSRAYSHTAFFSFIHSEWIVAYSV